MIGNQQQGKKSAKKKQTNTWRLTNILLNNKWITEEINEEIEKYLEANDNKDTKLQNLWDAAKPILRKVYGNTSPPQETRKKSNK